MNVKQIGGAEILTQLEETNFRTRQIPRSGSKAKDGEKKKKKRKEERLNDGNNNGQATHGARKHAWRTQAAWAKKDRRKTKKVSENNGQLCFCPQAVGTNFSGSRKICHVDKDIKI